jgi:hypothetical protein
MRAPFILQVFANHLNSIVGAEDVPSLEVAVGHGDSVRYPPKGALALAAAAVRVCLSTQQFAYIIPAREDADSLE